MKLLILLLVCSFGFTQEYAETNDYEYGQSLTIGETYSVFGDDVAFRAAPNPTAEILELIPIGKHVKILEKTDVQIEYHGMSSPYYKVKYNGKTGYVLGSLITFTSRQRDGSNFLFAFAKDDDQFYIKIRNYFNESYVDEYSVVLRQSFFKLDVYSNRGIEGIDAIVEINAFAEACGEIGGNTYLFYKNGEMRNSFELSDVSDAGVFWFSEEFIFPDEEDGVKNKILAKRNEGVYIDWDSKWIEEKTTTRLINWYDEEIFPTVDAAIAVEEF